jgi:hypothetical protein
MFGITIRFGIARSGVMRFRIVMFRIVRFGIASSLHAYDTY